MRSATAVIIATSRKESGAAVYDDAGTAIGMVGALVPTASGHIAFALVNLEMPNRIGGKRVVVPTTAFRTDRCGALVLPGGSVDRLHIMPEFASADLSRS